MNQVAAFFACLLCWGGLAAQDAPVLSETPTFFTPVAPLDFTLRLAAGWEKSVFPGQTYPLVYIAPIAGKFRANLNIVAERADIDHPGYVAASRRTLTQVFKTPPSEPTAVTMEQPDARCSVMTFATEQMGFRLRQRAFCISVGDGRHFVITQTALAADGDRHDAIVQAAVATFAIHTAAIP